MRHLYSFVFLIASITIFAQDRQAMEKMAMQAYRSGDYRAAYHQLFLSKQAYDIAGEKENAARCWLYMCSTLLFQGQFERCHQELDLVKDFLNTKLPDNRDLKAKFYQIHGALLSDESNYKEAIQQLQLSAKLYNKERKNKTDAVNVMNLMGNIYLEISEYYKALDTYRQALQILTTLPQKDLDSNALANTLGNIGATFQYLESWDSAYYYHNKSKRIYTSSLEPAHPKVANQVYNLALVDMETGKYDEAINGFQQALSIYENQEYPYHPELSEIYGSLGTVYAIKGEWEAAINSYYQDSSHTNRTFGPSHPFMANCYQEIASTYINKGNYTEAIRLLTKARNIYELSYTSNSNLVRNHLLLGKAYFFKGNYKESLNLLERARQMSNMLWKEENSVLAELNLLEGNALTRIGKFQEAKQKLYSCLSYYTRKKISFGTIQSEAHLTLATILDKENNPAASLKELIAGFEATKNNNSILYPYQYTQACLAIALHYEKTGRLKLALDYIDNAQVVSNRIRSMYAFETSAFSWAEKVSTLTELGMRICYKLFHENNLPNPYYLNKALAYTEYNKAFRLRQQTSGIQRNNLSGLSKKAIETDRRLKAEMIFYHAQLEALGNSDNMDRQKLLFLQDKIFSLSNEYDRFIEDVKKHHPEYFALIFENDTPDLENIIKSIPLDKSVLIFQTTDEFQYMIGLSKKSTPVFVRFNTDKMYNVTDGWVKSVIENDLKAFRKLSYNLYESLFQHLPISYQKNGLIVITDKLLQKVPFEALLTRETKEGSPKNFPYLVRRQNVIYSPSISLYLAKHDRWRNKKAMITAFVPFYSAVNVGSFGELNAIKENFESRVLAGKNANKMNLQKCLQSSDIIHFATHGRLNNKYPLQSYLELTDNDTIDPLYAYEMYAIKTKARLVTLGTCYSGDGPVAGGEGSINLARAFMYCGAKNIVMTLWAVPDNATSKILSFFYKNIAEGHSKEEALRSSKLSYLEHCDPAGAMPLYWAGTVITGDKYPLKLNKPWPVRNWWLVGLLLFIIGGVLGRFVFGKFVV